MRSVWAVARNTISQAIRMKIAIVVIAMLVILLPLMGVVMGGDGTLHGKLQTFVSYGLSLTSLLLCIMTIAVSTHTLTEDLKRKQIFLVLTKPIRRYQLVLGKFIGVAVLDVFLLGIFGSVIFGLTYMIPRIVESDEGQIAEANESFFTSRAVLTDPIDIKALNERVDEIFRKKWVESGELASDPSVDRIKLLKQTILAEEIGKETNIQPGGVKTWQFEGVRPKRENDILFVQFKFDVVTPGVEKIYTEWAVGDDRSAMRNSKTEIGFHRNIYPVRTEQEFKFPPALISEDGYVSVSFKNPFANNTVVVIKEIKLLYRAGTFAGNYMRVLGVILTRLLFLAALGVSVSTWLSFPVAILMCVVIFFAGTVNGFIVEAIGTLSEELFYVYKYTMRPILWLLPVFDGEYNPTPYLVSGESLKWGTLGSIFGVTGFIKSSVLIIVGMFIFNRREIAKVTT